MVALEHRVVLPAGFDEVVALVHDWSRDAEWRGVLSLTAEPPGPAVLGQRMNERLRFAGVVFTTPTEIDLVTTNPDGSRTAGFRGGSALLQVRGRRTVRSLGPDRTELVHALELQLGGILRGLSGPLAPAYARRVDADLERLRTRAWSPGPARPADRG